MRVTTFAPNQLLITDGTTNVFQSYETKIAQQEPGKATLLDPKWCFSKTTMKYCAQFLGEDNKKAIEKGIQSGKYVVQSLN